jgi:hypothetical protein
MIPRPADALLKRCSNADILVNALFVQFKVVSIFSKMSGHLFIFLNLLLKIGMGNLSFYQEKLRWRKVKKD